MLSKEQERVYAWLNDELGYPVFAEAYEGAIFLLEEKPPGYVSFICHAGRDIMNILARNVAGITAGRVQYQEHINKLQKNWQDEWRSTDHLSPEVKKGGHFIPITVCRSISNLIDEHNAGQVRSSEADGLFFSTFLDYTDKKRIPANFLKEWKAAKRWFMSHVHLREKPFREQTEKEITKHFNCLDNYLYIAASSQYDRLKDLNEILAATNR